MSRALTRSEIRTLADGAIIVVTWSGGNGPARYVHRDGSAWLLEDPDVFVGDLKLMAERVELVEDSELLGVPDKLEDVSTLEHADGALVGALGDEPPARLAVAELGALAAGGLGDLAEHDGVVSGGTASHDQTVNPGPAFVNSEKKESPELVLELEPAPAATCPHELLRMLAGGVCPECGPGAIPAELSARVDAPTHADQPTDWAARMRAYSVADDGALLVESAGEPVGGPDHEALTSDGAETPRVVLTEESPGWSGGPMQRDAQVAAHAADGPRFVSVPPTTVRPAGVEPSPQQVPPAEAHGPEPSSSDAPAYMRQPLRTLTREEAVRLLLRLQARRMRADFRAFIRGPEGDGIGGAWEVIEGETVLEWNFHHDAFCQHAQMMVEEWYLAGLPRKKIEPTLELWARQGRPYVASYRAHWERPAHEFELTPDGKTQVFGCGRGDYKQRATDLAVNVGPISLKSRIYMVFLIPWVWISLTARFEAFCSSGTPSNVSRDSLACRDLAISPWYRETFDIDWTIRPDLDRVDKWGTTAGGSREARGAGSSVTGIHADAILLDDPDDAKKVWSESERREIGLYWDALGNRLKDPKRPLRFIIQQNLHEEDLSTRCIARGMPRLAIPVEFDPDRRARLYTAPFGWVDPRKVKGDLIHPVRFPPEVLAKERVRLGTHGFEAQYNCNPSPLEGGLIQRVWFNFFRVVDEEAGDKPQELEQLPPRPTGCKPRDKSPAYVLGRKRRKLGQRVGALDLDTLTISVDATFGATNATSSAVGLLVIGNKGLRRFVFEDRTKPMTFLETCAAIRALIKRWPAKRILIELKANGASIIESLTKEMQDGELKGPDGESVTVVIEPITPEGGKESRAAAMVPEIEAGNVYLLDGAFWLEDFVGEVCVFPNAKRDDRVDALSQHMTYYRESDVVGKWKKMGSTARHGGVTVVRA